MKACKRCLMYEGMSIYLTPSPIPQHLLDAFHVEADGTCSVCHAYDAALDRDAVAEELEQLLFECDGLGQPALVAISGGKDSLSALYAVRRTLGLDAVGALFQNTFIPEDVVARCRDATSALDVPFHVLTPGPQDAALFLDDVTHAAPDRQPPCARCARLIVAQLLQLSDEVGAPYIVQGTNYFAHWGKKVVASIPQKTPAGRTVTFINLPFALGMTSADTQANLDALGVQPRRDLPGVSTNCRVPGIIQEKLAQVIGHVPELEDLAVEILVGHRTRDAALAELRRKAPAHAALVEQLAAVK